MTSATIAVNTDIGPMNVAGKAKTDPWGEATVRGAGKILTKREILNISRGIEEDRSQELGQGQGQGICPDKENDQDLDKEKAQKTA